MKLRLLLAALVIAGPVAVAAQDNCAYRGELDSLYCDANRDLVADPPVRRQPARRRRAQNSLRRFARDRAGQSGVGYGLADVEHGAQPSVAVRLDGQPGVAAAAEAGTQTDHRLLAAP